MVSLRILFTGFLLLPIQTFAQDAGVSGIAANDPIVADIETLKNMANNFGSAKGPVVAAANTIRPKGSYCESLKKAADVACMESLNPNISAFVSKYGDPAQLVMMMGSSIGDQCKGISNVLGKASMALGLFQAGCASAQAACTSSCGNLSGSIKSLKSAEEAAIKQLKAKHETTATAMKAACATATPACATATQAEQQAEMEWIVAEESKKQMDPMIVSLETKVNKKENVCASEYKISGSQAMLGTLSALKGFAQAKKCEDQNTNAQIAGIDCNNPQSPGYTSPNCQCSRGEKSAAECQGININTPNINAGTITLPDGTVAAVTGDGSGAILDMGGGSGTAPTNTAALSGAPPPIGGGGGGVGGSGGGSGGAGQDGAPASRKLNTNILGGGFGGGGGGGGSGAGGPGYGELDSKLKNYMPGEKNDPSRSVASQLAKEVTAPAGRTNWEKVRMRYRDNITSLLNK